eukprot:SAG11_NODE_8495_length_1009_cov_1.289011_1_plen_181_part_00
MEVLRTPDAAFEGLPGWKHVPSYYTSTLFGSAVRIAYYDLGARPEKANETLLLTHGEPSWSYIYRNMSVLGTSSSPSTDPPSTCRQHLCTVVGNLLHVALNDSYATAAEYARRRLPGLLATRDDMRIVLFDQVGFGRSDKPAAESDHTYARHVAWNIDLLVNRLDLRGVRALDPHSPMHI